VGERNQQRFSRSLGPQPNDVAAAATQNERAVARS